MTSQKSKLNLSILIICSIFSTNVRSSDEVLYLEKDQKAPQAGFFFSEQKAKEVRLELLELDKKRLEFENSQFKADKLTEVIKLKDTEIEMYRNQNNRLIKLEQTSDTMRYVWFGLGILATGVAVYGARGLAQQ